MKTAKMRLGQRGGCRFDILANVVKPPDRLLLLILCVGLVIRIIWAMLAPTSLNQLPDQQEYLSIAQNLLHHGSLCFFDRRFGQTVWAYRMPGYPAFLAACGGSVRVIRLAQCIVDVSTLWAVYQIARCLTASSATGAIAAGVMAVNPFYIYFSSTVLSETLFTALLTWSLWYFVCRPKALPIMLGVAFSYVRPSGLLLMPLLILAAPLNPSSSPSYPVRKRFLLTIVTTATIVISLLPWALRNHNRLDAWILTTTNSGITAFDGFHPGADGSSNQRFITDYLGLTSMNEVERSRFFARQAMDWAIGHKAEIPALSARKIFRGWSPVPLSHEFGKKLYRVVSALYAVPFALLCVVGLFSRKLTRRTKLLLLTPAIYFTVVQVMSVGSIRYRMPAEAPLAILVAVGVVELVGLKKLNEPIHSNANVDH